MRREVAALQPLHYRRVAVDLVARRNRRGIRRERRARARSLEVGDAANYCRGEDHENGHDAPPDASHLAVSLRPVGGNDLDRLDSLRPQRREHGVAALGLHRRLVPRPVARLVCVGVFHRTPAGRSPLRLLFLGLDLDGFGRHRVDIIPYRLLDVVGGLGCPSFFAGLAVGDNLLRFDPISLKVWSKPLDHVNRKPAVHMRV